jgi:integrase
MASVLRINGRWRALIRKSGITRCKTFDTKSAAKTWSTKVEAEVDGYRATGKFSAGKVSIGDLIQRYTAEIYPLKPYGRNKQAELGKLEREIGRMPSGAGLLTSGDLERYYDKRTQEGAGPTVVSGSLCYLGAVLKVARYRWKLDTALEAVKEAKSNLALVGLSGKSNNRDRRVKTDEIVALTAHFRGKNRGFIPMADIIEFALATGMRLGEICRIRWEDHEPEGRIILIRDRKHPKDKIGNNQRVPLLTVTGFDPAVIIARQPRKSDRIFPVNERSVSRMFAKATEALDIEDLHFHDLRHEAISRFFAAGYRIEQVALVSGHRDWAMLRRYTHVKAEDLIRV